MPRPHANIHAVRSEVKSTVLVFRAVAFPRVGLVETVKSLIEPIVLSPHCLVARTEVSTGYECGFNQSFADKDFVNVASYTKFKLLYCFSP